MADAKDKSHHWLHWEPELREDDLVQRLYRRQS